MAPRVLCVMLAAGRQAMVERAVRSFISQSYPDKWLYVLDNGSPAVNLPARLIVPNLALNGKNIFLGQTDPGKPIGTLRNLANAMSIPLECDVIAHWDSDDWSHPERLTEQVALLKASGKQAVGYREVLFWDTVPGQFCGAWLYSNPNPAYCVGSSLMYWRDTWLKRPFTDQHTGEDTTFWLHVKAAAQTSLSMESGDAPRMICSIHGTNTHARIEPNAPAWPVGGGKPWTRTPEWDAICRERMAL